MIQLPLIPHPDFVSKAAAQIAVAIAHSSIDELKVTYMVTGNAGEILVPPVALPERSDELWRHTCFELFVATADRAGYYEFNFSPSTQWAAYGFDGYRSGRTAATEIEAPRIEMQSAPDRYRLQVLLHIPGLVSLSRKTSWRLGLSALIEDKAGNMSYWALAHPPGKPDFHHRDCFAYELSRDVSA